MSEDFTTEEKEIKHKVSREEFERRRKEKRKEQNRKKIILILVLVAIVALIVSLVALGTGLVSGIMKKAGVKVDVNYVAKTREVQYNFQAATEMFAAGDSVYVYNPGQFVCYNKDTVTMWREELADMTAPSFSVMSQGIIVYDAGGNSMQAYSEEGLIWEKRIGGNIRNVYYNDANNIGAVLYEDGTYRSSLIVFKAEGRATKDLFTKNYASQYLTSCAISDNGRSLALSGISAESGSITGIISLIDMDGGENYYTKYTEGYALPYVGFVSEKTLCAAGPEQLAYIKNDMTVGASEEDAFRVIKEGAGSVELLSVDTAETGFCVSVFGSGDGGCDVLVCDSEGKIISTETYTESIIGVKAFGKHFAMYSENKVCFLDEKGKVLCSEGSVSDISGMYFLSEYSVFVTHGKGDLYVDFVEQ